MMTKTEQEMIDSLPEESRKLVKLFLLNKPKDLTKKPKKNVWYVYRPEGCICSEGSLYFSSLKIGTENKVLVLFCGGGVAVDSYSAARPDELVKEEGKDTFYFKTTAVVGYFMGH